MAYDLKSGYIVRGNGEDVPFEMEGRKQQYIAKMVSAVIAILVVLFTYKAYFEKGMLAPVDAVYVATGADGADFGLEMDPDGAFATRTPGVFIGGSLTGGDSMKALADGLAVSLAIERYLKTGGMNEPFRKEGTLLNLQTNGIERADRVVPANGESYTEEEAMQEIARCQKCSCDACMRACERFT